jgi:hypothetical protein
MVVLYAIKQKTGNGYFCAFVRFLYTRENNKDFVRKNRDQFSQPGNCRLRSVSLPLEAGPYPLNCSTFFLTKSSLSDRPTIGQPGWRNGRRAGLKNLWEQSRESSNLSPGTKTNFVGKKEKPSAGSVLGEMEWKAMADRQTQNPS